MREQNDSVSVSKVIIALAVLGIILMVFLSFHFVFYEGGISIIPKNALTFRLTIISLSDVIDRWNSEMNLLSMASDKLFVNLVNALERKGLITREERERSEKKTW